MTRDGCKSNLDGALVVFWVAALVVSGFVAMPWFIYPFYIAEIIVHGMAQIEKSLR